MMLWGLQKPLCRKHGVGTIHEDLYDSRSMQPSLQDEFPDARRDCCHPRNRRVQRSAVVNRLVLVDARGTSDGSSNQARREWWRADRGRKVGGRIRRRGNHLPVSRVFLALVSPVLSKLRGRTSREERCDAQRESCTGTSVRTHSQKWWPCSTRPVVVRLQG